MNNPAPLLLPEVGNYLGENCVRVHPVAQALYQHTQARVSFSQWLTTPEQVQFLALLIKMLSACLLYTSDAADE